MDVLLAIIFLVLLGIGIKSAWADITNGTGFFGSRISPKTLAYLNSGNKMATARKVATCVIQAYFVLAIKFMAFIIGLFALISHSLNKPL